VTAVLPLRYYRCHRCDWRELRRRQGPPITVSRPRRMRGVIFYVKVLGILIALAVVGYILIAPYTNMPKPISPHTKSP
jgi:hypothetical protein